MLLTSLLTIVLASLARTTLAQDEFGPIKYDSIHNATAITGTWSTGSKAVSTGAGFADPANMTFFYPNTTGISFSFSDQGFYEISRYRFNGNGSQPTCITGVIGWVHGTYSLNANGSISMTPMGDGFQQVQDPCAAQSNFIELYNQTEYYKGWRIFQDPSAGPKLHMFQFDGSPLPPMFQLSTTPNMLPTRLLRGGDSSTDSVQRRSEESGAQDLVLGGSHYVKAFAAAAGLAVMSGSLMWL